MNALKVWNCAFSHTVFRTGWKNTIHNQGAINRIIYRSFAKQLTFSKTFNTNINFTQICSVRNSLHFTKAFMNTSSLDVNTNVAKDIILFRYENPKFFRMVNVFAICQFCFWTYLSHFAFTTLRDAPVPKEQEDDNPSWWRKVNLGENKYRNGLTILSFLVGYCILTSAWLYTLKSVRYLILRKGGEQVTFVTYTPFGKNRMMTVGLNKISCTENRQNARVTLPIKVQKYTLHYMLDMKGEFKNPKLFDHTAGLKRQLKE